MHTIAKHPPTPQAHERVRTLLTRYRAFVYLAALLLAALLVTVEARQRADVPYPVDDRPLVLPER